MTQKIMQAEILFCLAFYRAEENTKNIITKIEVMKYGLAMLDMLEVGDIDYDSKKKVWTLTEQGKKVAKELYEDNK